MLFGHAGRSVFAAAFCSLAVSVLTWEAGGADQTAREYSVLEPLLNDNLAVFPVMGKPIANADSLLTLDEGLRTGQVVVTEYGGVTGLERPRPRITPPIFPERPPIPGNRSARVDELALVNHSASPLLLLAGEIVTGGKQDRIVGKDRIVRPHSDPIALGVFCVEPHRWTATTEKFGGSGLAMAQPGVRKQAMAVRDQQAVWNQVAASRSAFAGADPEAMRVISSSSSYATAIESDAVQKRLSALAEPIAESYEKLMGQLREQKALGAVVAVNGELVWVDVFATPGLFEKYWPKLIRSYAAEAVTGRVRSAVYQTPGVDAARRFLNNLAPVRESMESEPGVYRNTEIIGHDFEAFSLTALLPGTGYQVHFAKMIKK
jgi:hypothetical protein